MGLSKSYLHICLYYEEVEKSYQTNKGRLVCVLKNVEKSSFVVKDKEGREKAFMPEDGMIALDEEDDYYSEEDMKWDRLHKHGL